MRFVSHTRNEVLLALSQGKSVFALDTGSDGDDDVLIGTEEECRQDVMTFHKLEHWFEDWTLSPVINTLATLVVRKA